MEQKNRNGYAGNFNRFRYFLGAIVPLAFTLIAFEWKTYDEIPIGCLLPNVYEEIDEDNAPITYRSKVKPPPPLKIDIKISEVDPKEFIEETHEEPINTPKEFEIGPDNTPEFPPEIVVENLPVVNPQEPAEFPGGEEALFEYLSSNIKYPELARVNGIEGKVFLTFIVEKDGSISNIEILRGVHGGKMCDTEAVRVVSSMPRWKPGKQRGRKVRVRFNLPISFKLNKT